MEKLNASFMGSISTLDDCIKKCEGNDEHVAYLSALKKIFEAVEITTVNLSNCINNINGHTDEIN